MEGKFHVHRLSARTQAQTKDVERALNPLSFLLHWNPFSPLHQSLVVHPSNCCKYLSKMCFLFNLSPTALDYIIIFIFFESNVWLEHLAADVPPPMDLSHIGSHGIYLVES